jgi:Ribonuclease 2-5A
MGSLNPADLPSDLSFTAILRHDELLGTSSSGVRTYNGVLQLGSSEHPVLIKRKKVERNVEPRPSPEMQALIDQEPLFSDHYFTRCEDGELITVRARQECTLADLPTLPLSLSQLPPWQVVKQCIAVVRKLHLNRYTHRDIHPNRFACVDTGRELEIRLTDFHYAQPFPDDESMVTRLVNNDLRRLGNCLFDFLKYVQLHEPDRECERFPLLYDLIRRIIDGSQRDGCDMELLSCHPAIQSYDRCLALICAVSDAISTAPEEDAFGFSLLEALDAASGRKFVRWDEKFMPETPKIADDWRSQDHKELVWNQLDRFHSLQRSLRVCRNRSAHRIPELARTLGEIPQGFTQTWMSRLPDMWISAWDVITTEPFRLYFSRYYRTD